MIIEDSPRLAALGWDAAWAAAFDAACHTLPHRDTDPLSPARVTAEHRDRYDIGDAEGERSAVLSGRFRNDATTRDALPSVGDWIVVSSVGDGTAVVRAVVPRRSAFVRKSAGDTTLVSVFSRGRFSKTITSRSESG